jgi:cell division protein FtsB
MAPIAGAPARLNGTFASKFSPGRRDVRLAKPYACLKENVMRISMLALAGILTCVAAPLSAQVVIDVEGQKAASPRAQDQDQPQERAPTQVDENQRPATQSRFSFSRVDNGFLRLDNDTGQVAFCSTQAAGWVCQSGTENRAALETEIASVQKQVASLKELETEIAGLRRDVASLKKEIAALKEPPAPRPPGELAPRPGKGADVTVKLPSHEDLVKARDFIEEAWRRLVEMIATMQKDVMRKG